MRTWSRAAALAVGVSIMTMPGASGSSTDGNDSSQEREDIARYAQSEGVSFDEAYDQLHWQPEFVDAVENLRINHPDDFAGAGIDEYDGSPSAWIGYARSTPEGGLPRVDGVELRAVENKGFTEAELIAYAGDVAASYAGAGGYRNFSVTPRHETGRVVVAVLDDERSSEASAAARNATPEPPHGSKLIEISKPAKAQPTLRGGGRLEATSSNDLKCTSAFAVQNSSGTRGFLTAQHCTLPFTHEDTSGGFEYGATGVSSHRGYYGDFRWYTTTTSELDDFQYLAGYWRDLTDIGVPVINQTLARFGHKTGDQYDDVYALGVWSHIDGVSTGSLVAMDNKEADVGDSGGPWFWLSKGYGIHHGHDYIGGCCVLRDMFSTVSNATSTLGVTLSTS